MLNSLNYSIDLYELTGQKLVSRIPIQPQVDQGIDKLYSFYYHNKDSIFVFSQFRLSNAMIVNHLGEFVNRLSLNNTPGGSNGIINHISNPSMPTYFRDNKLYISVLQMNDKDISDPNFVYEYVVDTKLGEFTGLSFIKKPISYREKPVINEGFSRIITLDKKFVYSWNLSDSVVFYYNEVDSLVFKTIPMFGKTQTKPVEVNKNMNLDQKLLETAKSYVYGKFFIDYQNRLIHRLRYLPMSSPEDLRTGLPNAYLRKDFEILTASLEGNYLGSTQFKAGVYDPRLLFFHDSGIYLPKIHPEYSELKENQISYDVYKVNHKK